MQLAVGDFVVVILSTSMSAGCKARATCATLQPHILNRSTRGPSINSRPSNDWIEQAGLARA